MDTHQRIAIGRAPSSIPSSNVCLNPAYALLKGSLDASWSSPCPSQSVSSTKCCMTCLAPKILQITEKASCGLHPAGHTEPAAWHGVGEASGGAGGDGHALGERPGGRTAGDGCGQWKRLFVYPILLAHASRHEGPFPLLRGHEGTAA